MNENKEIQYLKNKWYKIAPKTKISEDLFSEIISAYNQNHRYYHNIKHLVQMFSLYDKNNYFNNIVFFATFYHDFVYRIGYKFNELHSAFIIRSRLMQINISDKDINKIEKYIKATELHYVDKKDNLNDNDINIFLDCDMSILGTNKEEYQEYFLKIRKEYEQYQEEIYKKYRVKFLKKLIKEDKIFKSSMFENFENKAKENIKFEINYWEINKN